MRPLLLSGFLMLLTGGISVAVDITTAAGQSYENAEVRGIEGGSVILSHTGGVVRVPLTELSDELRSNLGIEPTVGIAKVDLEAKIGSLKQAFSDLDKAYANKLSEIEENAKSQGRLEDLIGIQKELEDLKKNAPLDTPANGELLKVRGIYQQELKNRKAQAFTSLKEAVSVYQATLKKIQEAFTRSGEIEKAVEVKKEIEEIGSKVRLPELSLVTFGLVAPSTPQPPSPAPLPVGAGANAGQPLCRIVIVGTSPDAGDAIHETFEMIRQTDRTDLVRIGRTIRTNIGAIASDGSLVYWREGSTAPEVIPGDHVQCEQNFGLPLVGLRRDGTLSFTSEVEPAIAAKLKQETSISQISATSGALGLVSSSDHVAHVIGRSDHPTAQAIAKLENISELDFSGLAFAHLLLRDGTIIISVNGETHQMTGFSDFVRLPCYGIGERASGELVSLNTVPQAELDSTGPNPRRCFQGAGYYAAIDRNQGFHLFNSKGELRNSIESDIEEALTGAVDFTLLFEPDGPVWIAALIPSQLVSRSGLWELSELIADRQKR
ncbi:MAG: hypothetical protein KDN19_05310 [Verrucomicrobiae bacterium]|nr:hypothetical protein [Verrucomicrobiae bacterium]